MAPQLLSLWCRAVEPVCPVFHHPPPATRVAVPPGLNMLSSPPHRSIHLFTARSPGNQLGRQQVRYFRLENCPFVGSGKPPPSVENLTAALVCEIQLPIDPPQHWRIGAGWERPRAQKTEHRHFGCYQDFPSHHTWIRCKMSICYISQILF